MSRPHLIYLSPVSIDSFAQRPHHFVEWFHQRFGGTVTWIEPGPSRYPRWRDFKRIFQRHHARLGPDWTKQGWLIVERFACLPLEPHPVGRWINRALRHFSLKRLQRAAPPRNWLVLGKPCDLALQLLDRLDTDLTVFDVMDNMAAFNEGAASHWVASAENRIANRVDVIMASSVTLASLLNSRYATAHVRCIRNGLTPPNAKDLARSATVVYAGPIVFGYVGVIASWFDWASVIQLARTLPDAQVHLYGPVAAPIPAQLPKNVRLFAGIPQSEVYSVIHGFTCGLIPFLKNALTDYVDPIKYYEYRAIGKPVLSSRFGDMQQRGAADQVYFLEDLFDGKLDIRACVNHSVTPPDCADFCRDNAWGARFGAIDFFPAPG